MDKKTPKLLIITFILLPFFILSEAKEGWAIMVSRTKAEAKEGWSEMVSGTDIDLLGISGRSKTDIFAVGKEGIILHYDGDGNNDRMPDNIWEEMSRKTKRNLNAVWGGSDRGVFAVGDGGSILFYKEGKDEPIIMRIDTEANIYGIWGSSRSNVFAVGDGGTVLHYKGKGEKWYEMPTPTDQNLNGIWGSSGDTVFAVGDGGTILHYRGEGEKWHEMLTPTKQNLNGIWGTSINTVFAVGDDGTVLRYNGEEWSEMPTPTKQKLNGVWGSSINTVFAVGDDGTVLHYKDKGEKWYKMPKPTHQNLNGVWVSPNPHLFVAGANGKILNYPGYYIEGEILDSCTGSVQCGDLVGIHGKVERNVPPWQTLCTTNINGYYPPTQCQQQSNELKWSDSYTTTIYIESDPLTVAIPTGGIYTNTFLLPSDPNSYGYCISGVVSKKVEEEVVYYQALEDITVDLYKIACGVPDTKIATMQTDSKGHFCFKLAPPGGNYKLVIEDQSGYTFLREYLKDVFAIPSGPQMYDWTTQTTTTTTIP